MPFAFLIVGTLFVVSGVRGTDSDLFDLVQEDFQPENGKPGFIAWLISILLIGALGYIEPIKPIARAFMVLVIVVLFLSNGGFFQKFIAGTVNFNESQSKESK